MTAVTLEEVAGDLYGLVPEEFTAERNARAKTVRAAGDRQLAEEIRRLRKPTTAAWLINRLVRRHSEEVSQLLALGEELREAHRHLEGKQLRALDQQRRRLIHALSAQVKEFAAELGRQLSDQVSTEVEETLRAAIADPRAGAAISSGLLTDTFEATGLTPVDLDGVVAVPTAALAPTPGTGAASGHRRDTQAERARADAERALAEAESELRRSEETVKAATAEVADARSSNEELQSDRERLEQQLRAIQGEIKAATQTQAQAEHQQARAERDEAAARRAVEQARARLSELD